MSKVFLNRLEKVLEKTKGDTVSLPSIASQIVSKYFEEENRNLMSTLNRMREIDIELDNEEAGLWPILCSQVLVLMYNKNYGTKEDKDKIVEGINDTLKKFDEIEEYKDEVVSMDWEPSNCS